MKKTKGKIPILHCKYDKLIDPNQLKPHPANPAKHPEKQVKLLARIISEHGIRHAITVSKRSGFIVAGHCRCSAAIELGIKEYPVTYQDFKSEAEELAVLVADNAIQELAEVDSAKMGDIVKELESVDYDLTLMAIDAEDLVPVQLEYKEETLQPYSRTHILLSFEPSLLMKIQPYLEKILSLGEIEVEQSSN
jgi:ParB-like chromosome segregation protein Spo0J